MPAPALTLTVVTLVITPLLLTVTTGINVADPYVLAVTPDTGKSALTKALKAVGALAPLTAPA